MEQRRKLPFLKKSFAVELVVNEKNIDFESIKNANSEIAVLAAFGKILPMEILNHFKYGVLNIHPSLLPKYRGPSPIQSAILSGEKETGVTVIKLDEQIDHGPILAQQKLQILPTDTAKSLYQKLFPLGAKLVIENLPHYLSGQKVLREQNHQAATYTKPLIRQDGYADFANIEPETFERKIRAYFPWPGVWSKIMINNKLLVIKFLPEKMVQVEGGKPMNYKDFINGYPNVDKKLIEFLKTDF